MNLTRCSPPVWFLYEITKFFCQLLHHARLNTFGLKLLWMPYLSQLFASFFSPKFHEGTTMCNTNRLFHNSALFIRFFNIVLETPLSSALLTLKWLFFIGFVPFCFISSFVLNDYQYDKLILFVISFCLWIKYWWIWIEDEFMLD